MFPASQIKTSAEVERLIETIPLRHEEIAHRLGRNESTLYRWRRGTTKPSLAALDLLRRLALSFTRPVDVRPDFRFIDLFAGIGGMRLGVETVGGHCVFSCERDKFSRQTYEANFADGPEHPFPIDITTVAPETIPAHDLLLAGFPCQPFSIAGVSKKNALGRPHGFSCLEQGNLFFNIADILAVHRPAAFILENVKNLKSHDKGKTFATIKETLQDTLGYSITTRVIDAKAFVPQHRERIFVVGFREDVGFSLDDLVLPPVNEGPRLSDVLHPENGSERPEWPYTEGASATVARRYVLTNHLWAYLRAYAKKHQEKGNGFGFGLVGPGDVTRTLSARYFKDGSEILLKRGRGNPRRLTPRECARLMGFDHEARTSLIPVSDTQAYRQFGNSVVVPVVEAVARATVPYLLRLIGGEQMSIALDRKLA
ncbi:MAG: DNA (cytosine-5-)-methyltransferase [Acidobacteriota bacterium]|nr:DNA (cytosine-5-)-methyltransferase [Acidobacteriota bacterium]